MKTWSHFIGSEDNLGGKGPLNVCSSASCSKQSQLRGQRKLFRVLSSWISKTCTDGDCTTSLGSLFQCLIIPTMKRFFLWPKLNLFCFNLYLLPLTRPPLSTVKSLVPLSRIYRGAAIRTPKALSSLNKPVPSVFLHRTSAPVLWLTSWLNNELAPSLLLSFSSKDWGRWLATDQ